MLLVRRHPASLSSASQQAQGLGLWLPMAQPVADGNGSTFVDLVRGILATQNVTSTSTVVWTYDPVIGWGPKFTYVTTNCNIGFTTAFPATTKLSMSCWVRLDGTIAAYQTIVQSRTANLAGLIISGGASTPLTGMWTNVAGEFNAATGLVLTVGRPAFCGMTVDGTTLTVYKGDMDGGFSSFTITITSTSQAETAWNIGQDVGGTPSRVFPGLITDVRIWPTRVLTPQEMYALWHPTTRWALYEVAARRRLVVSASSSSFIPYQPWLARAPVMAQ